MTAIHQQLKLLRQAKGLTQEAVAQKVGVTRQAISSYESGRTQPDLDMLRRFAEVYDVALEDILYGKNPSQARRRRVRAAVVLCLIAGGLCALAPSGLNLMLNTWFQVADGTPAELRFRLLSLRDGAGGITGLLFLLTLLLLVIFSQQLERPLPLRRRAGFCGLLVLILLLLPLPFALTDPLYAPADYLLTTLNYGFWSVLAFLLDWFLGALRQRRAP